MNQKELGEIRRRFRLDHNNIQHIYGCYVNSNREIISYIDESIGLLSKEEVEKYLALLKKTLSGSLGRKVKIAHKGNKGKIELEYYNPDDLETLLDTLKQLGMKGDGL